MEDMHDKTVHILHGKGLRVTPIKDINDECVHILNLTCANNKMANHMMHGSPN